MDDLRVVPLAFDPHLDDDRVVLVANDMGSGNPPAGSDLETGPSAPDLLSSPQGNAGRRVCEPFACGPGR